MEANVMVVMDHLCMSEVQKCMHASMFLITNASIERWAIYLFMNRYDQSTCLLITYLSMYKVWLSNKWQLDKGMVDEIYRAMDIPIQRGNAGGDIDEDIADDG